MGVNNDNSSTVLVVEDFNDTRMMLNLLLSSMGYYVLEAEDGRQAVEMAKLERPQMILMDLSLPVLDGIAATKLIREEGFLNDVPIVAVTAHQESEYREKALAAGCNDFINKPMDFKKLESLLSKFMPASRVKSA